MEQQLKSRIKDSKKVTGNDWIKFILLSFIGIFMFFISIEINGKTTIPLDHLVTFIKNTGSVAMPYYGLIVIILGAAYPFYDKSWNKDMVTSVFSIAKVVGLFVAV